MPNAKVIPVLLRAAQVAALLFPGLASSEPPSLPPPIRESGNCYVLTTYNQTPKWVWITVYVLAKVRHLDYGYVAPFSKREWRAGNYACGSYYYVRGEVKASEDTSHDPGNPPNIFDTTVQAHFLSFSPGSVTGSVVYIKTKVLTAYVDQPVNTWSYDNRSFWWDVDDAQPHADQVTRMFVNATFTNANPAGAFVTVTTRTQPASTVWSMCVAPNAQVAQGATQLRPGSYHVKAVTGVSGCDSNGARGNVTHTAESDLDVSDQHWGVNLTAGLAATLAIAWQQ